MTEAVERYRQYASECLRLAQESADDAQRAPLLEMAAARQGLAEAATRRSQERSRQTIRLSGSPQSRVDIQWVFDDAAAIGTAMEERHAQGPTRSRWQELTVSAPLAQSGRGGSAYLDSLGRRRSAARGSRRHARPGRAGLRGVVRGLPREPQDAAATHVRGSGRLRRDRSFARHPVRVPLRAPH